MILLNPRHEKFAQAMAVEQRRTAAYEEAGFSAQGRSGYKSGKRLLGNLAAAARIEELHAEALDDHRLNRRKILRFLADVIQTPAGHGPPGGRLCQGYRITGQPRSLTMPDKLGAVALCVKLCGWERQQPKEEPRKVTKIAIGGMDFDQRAEQYSSTIS